MVLYLPLHSYSYGTGLISNAFILAFMWLCCGRWNYSSKSACQCIIYSRQIHITYETLSVETHLFFGGYDLFITI